MKQITKRRAGSSSSYRYKRGQKQQRLADSQVINNLGAVVGSALAPSRPGRVGRLHGVADVLAIAVRHLSVSNERGRDVPVR